MAKLPPVLHAWPDLSPARLTTFVCCDGPYLKRHGLAFARSLDKNAPGTHLHIHLINPDTNARRRAATLELSRTTLSHSIESFDFTHCSSGFARTYCASIRFVRQFQLLCARAQPVFSFDVDVLVRGSLEPLRETLIQGGYDCAIHTRLKTRRRKWKFLASAFYVSPSPGGRSFLGGLAARIATALVEGRAAWYLDQLALYDCYRAHRRAGTPLHVYHLPKALSDWDFDTRSTLWVAKGRHKTNEVFLAHQSAYRTPEEKSACLPVASPSRPRVGIVLPRLDLPFRKPAGPKDLCSLVKGPGIETRRLRRHWRDFSGLLGDAFREAGCEVRLEIRPLWRVTTDLVEGLNVDLAFIPHKQRFDLPGLHLPAYFYTQQFFPWLFSVDPLGWNAAGALYPCDDSSGDTDRGTFERYAERIVRPSACAPSRLARQALVARGDIPDGPYIFVPYQSPTDQTIRLFCDHDPVDVVGALAGWTRRRAIPLVLEAHSMHFDGVRSFPRAKRDPEVYWSTANVHDLIAHSAAVYVINDSVGFEALLHDKPVVTFGRVEYDAVTIHGSVGALDATWDAVVRSDPVQRAAAYRRFVDWYCRIYCFDLSDPAGVAGRLAALVEQTVPAPVHPEITESAELNVGL